MLRSPFIHQFRRLSTPVVLNNRNLVSSVLLTRTWDNVTLADLKQEARKRGIPLRGNKATLITRIQEYDQRIALEPTPSRDPPAQARNASTTAASSTPPPRVPDSLPATIHAKNYLDIKLPDLSAPPPETPVQIPFSPDFWESSRAKAEAVPPPVEPTVPKMLVVAGSSTHPAGGPSHNLYGAEAAESLSDDSSPSSDASGLRGLWVDVADDLGLPSTLTVGASTKIQRELMEGMQDETSTTAAEIKGYTRNLDGDEVRGVWTIVGVLVGSWLLGGILRKDSAIAEHPLEEVKTQPKGNGEA